MAAPGVAAVNVAASRGPIPAWLLLALLAPGGCVSVPVVNPPDPLQPLEEGQMRRFEGVTPAEVLAAADLVLRTYRPKGRSAREDDGLVFVNEDSDFLLIGAAARAEKWVVTATRKEDATVASVAMRTRGSGALLLLGGGYEFPHKGIRIDYSLFWQRMRDALGGEVGHACAARNEVETGCRYYEPLCANARAHPSAPD